METTTQTTTTTNSRYITIEPNENKSNDWLMIELQGEILRSKVAIAAAADDFSGSHLWNGKLLGKLINQDSDSPVLIIGNSKLEGKRMKMTKPLAILKKIGDNQYETKGFVSNKLLFKTRPKPLSSV